MLSRLRWRVHLLPLPDKVGPGNHRYCKVNIRVNVVHSTNFIRVRMQDTVITLSHLALDIHCQARSTLICR
jgi:hypothetical protein